MDIKNNFFLLMDLSVLLKLSTAQNYAKSFFYIWKERFRFDNGTFSFII